MISRIEDGRARTMTVRCDEREALAVFGHEEEAERFLRSLADGAAGDGWRVKESRCGEVVSLLSCPHARLGAVALHPPPGAADDGTAALVSLDRRTFTKNIL